MKQINRRAFLKKADSVDSKSLLPIINDCSVQIRDCIYLGYREFQRAVVEKRYKLIEYVKVTQTVKGETITAGSRKTQLFDLQNDPWETTNLAQHPNHVKTVKRLQIKLNQLREEYHDGTERGKQKCPEMHEQYLRFWNNY